MKVSNAALCKTKYECNNPETQRYTINFGEEIDIPKYHQTPAICLPISTDPYFSPHPASLQGTTDC
jgi:hypothetical protein